VIFVPIPRERIPQEWERIIALIGPAVDGDKEATRKGLYRELMAGRTEAFWIGVPVHVTGVGVTTISDGECWINYVGGEVNGGPRAFVNACRSIVAEIEKLARTQGCKWLVMGGRNWSRVFPEWEHADPDYPNRIRKAI
jgi:hypothetical protein